MIGFRHSFPFLFKLKYLTWLPIIGLWLLFIGMVYYFSHNSFLGLKAFEVYYISAESLKLSVESIYEGTNGWIYLYPPLLSQLLIPIASVMNYQAASDFWLIMNIALLIMTIASLQRYIPVQWSKLLWVMPIVFIPIWQAMYIGQVTIIMLALLTFIWVAIHEGHNRTAGMLLALAAWIKVFPAILIIYFLYKRNWQVILGTFIGGITLLLLQAVISGPEPILDFIKVLYLLIKEGQPSATFENLSIFGFVSRLFQVNSNVRPIWVNDDLFYFIRWLITGSIIAATMFSVYKSHHRSGHRSISWQFDVEYGLVILTTLMLGSTLWVSGLPPILLIGLLIIRHHRNQMIPQVRLFLWCAFMLIMIYQPIIVIATVFKITLDALTLSIGFFGLMISWGLMIWLLLFEPEPK